MSIIVGGSLGGSSLSSRVTQSSFNIDIESDVISLLKLVHTNTLDPDLKNELRDFVFGYRTDQSEQTAQELTDAFARVGISVISKYGGETVQIVMHREQVVKFDQKNILGMVRPKPRFVPVPSYKETKPEVKILKVATPQQWPETQKSELSVVEAVGPTSEVLVEAVPVPISPQINSAQIQDRIKEIKRIVNEQVGNPVNLIDTNNEVGREYMNALLDAMKKSNGGSAVETTDAMTRLENAFTLVKDVILKKNPVTGLVPQSVVIKKELPLHELSEAAAKELQATQPQFVTPKMEKTGPSLSEKFLENQQNDIVQSEVLPEVIEQNQSLKMAPVSEILAQSATQAAPQPEALPEKALEKTGAIAHSVAKEKQLQDLMRANREQQMQSSNEQEIARVAALDPLMTPEVNAGLSQLLSEWSLFKSSGIFGTGPSGKDHVLYKKLASLTMAAVIAGRFEGATPRIKQSITDYMNGWRYEEGVVHEHGESFEHYLRKVIRHILEKQKLNKIPQQ